jgi:hypothetical protein
MTALAHAERAAPGVQSEAGSLMAVISRAASDPNTDVDKLERLLAMYERITAGQAKAAYAAALAAMQTELPVIAERGGIRDRSGNVQSTYALWEDINDAVKPILARHGFALSFRTGEREGRVVVTGVLSHKDGHTEETTMTLPVDASGSKNAVQAVGSSTSYGKRYTAAALLNLTSRGEDDDGKAGGDLGLVTDQQLRTLQTLVDETRADAQRFCAFMKVNSLAEIPARDFDRAVAKLNEKKARANG